MNEQWQKLGLIFKPDKSLEWMHSHCQSPLVDHIEGNIFRIYFASRDSNNISRIGFVEMDIENPATIINRSDKPIIEPGDAGYFDQHGVFPSSVINYNGRKYLYYAGFIRGYQQPFFYAAIGLAISDDNGKTFLKYSKAPIMDRSEYDPCLVTSPNVFIENGTLRMTYVSGIKWEIDENNSVNSFYNIKYAESTDGINWLRDGTTAIDFMEGESNIARSSVLKENNIYKMWYCYVNRSIGKYRIGYAESLDFKNWVRKDNMAGITVSEDGFDNEMICYPNVFSHKGNKYMVYNGNNFGKDGIGLAIWK